jgi:fumarylacetoacetate (FAA) hydrolase
VKLATLRRGGRDGTLVIVSEDGSRGIAEPGGLRTLQAALDDWETAEPLLRRGQGELVELDEEELHSPLPRAYQWCDGSTFLTHMERIRASRKMALPPGHDQEPIVYQSGSDAFLAPTDPIPLRDESWGLDLEATVAVVTGDVPMGTTAPEVPAYVKLLLLTNDLTFRNIMPLEYAKSVGPYRAKPARAYAPLALTPDEVGDAWNGRLLRSTVRSWVNGELLGELRSDEDCAFDFGVLIEYLTMTRSLAAGTIIGSGTISNRDASRGFGCLAEKRAVEITASGEATTKLLRVGDTVRVEAFDDDGRSLFGALDQQVVAAPPTTKEEAR